MLQHRGDPEHRDLLGLAFGRRPHEELYDLSIDPHQMVNIASLPRFGRTRTDLARRLDESLRAGGQSP